MDMNLATAIVLAVVIVCVCLSVRSLRKKGMCGCKAHEGDAGGSCCGSCAGCSACADMERTLADAKARLDER